MTKIRFNPAPRWRESESSSRERGKIRHIAIATEPTALLFRLKGTRGVCRLPIATAYQMACQLEANRVRQERREARKARKAGVLC